MFKELLGSNLPWLITIILSIVGGIGTLLFYKKLKSYLQIIWVLIDGVEFCDDKIKDIVPDKAREVMKRIKETINGMLKPVDKEQLDKWLKERGYKEQ